jgi:hypothetical protein
MLNNRVNVMKVKIMKRRQVFFLIFLSLIIFIFFYLIRVNTTSDFSHCLLERAANNIATIKVITGRGQEGWFTVSNNNDFPVRLINLDRADAYFDLQNYQSRSFNFRGSNRIGCYTIRNTGIKGQDLVPISCEKVTIARCYPAGSPGGQGNRYNDLQLMGTRNQPGGVSQSGPPSKFTPTAGREVM